MKLNLFAKILMTVMSIVIMKTTTVSAQFATDGDGSYKGQIYWLKWKNGDGGLGLQTPASFNNGVTIENGQYIWYITPDLRVVGTVTNKGANDIMPYDIDGFNQNGLTHMYYKSVAPYLNPIGLRTNSTQLNTFDLQLDLEVKNSANVWINSNNSNQGMVFADAESMNGLSTGGNPDEYIEATTVGSQWYLIDLPKQAADKYANPASTTQLDNANYRISVTTPVSGNNKIKLSKGTGAQVGNTAVLLANGVHKLTNITMQGGGVTAMALGFFLPFDPGNAPSSFGEVFHLQEGFNTGTNNALSGDQSVATILSAYSNTLPKVISSTVAHFGNVPVAELSNIDNLDGVVLPYINQGYIGNLNVAITATNESTSPATISGWIDFNNDGKFSGNEYATINVPANTINGSFTLTFTGVTMASSILTGTSIWSRFRITTDDFVNTNANTPTSLDSRSVSFASNGEVSDFKIIIGTPLPIKLSSFDAVAQDGQVLLNWTTLSEENNKGFYIEHSGNGKNWTSLGFVDSKSKDGNAQQILNYNFVDPTPVVGKNFYRLKQLDFDGAFEYSKVEMVGINTAKTHYIISPSPTHGLITIQGTMDGEKLSVTNVQGSVIMNVRLQENKSIVDLSKVPSGMYFISIKGKDGVVNTQRIIKQ